MGDPPASFGSDRTGVHIFRAATVPSGREARLTAAPSFSGPLSAQESPEGNARRPAPFRSLARPQFLSSLLVATGRANSMMPRRPAPVDRWLVVRSPHPASAAGQSLGIAHQVMTVGASRPVHLRISASASAALMTGASASWVSSLWRAGSGSWRSHVDPQRCGRIVPCPTGGRRGGTRPQRRSGCPGCG